MKTVLCKSGLIGWQTKLHRCFENYQEFESYSNLFGLHTRLGYKTPRNAWLKNPTVQGSTDPADYKKVK